MRAQQRRHEVDRPGDPVAPSMVHRPMSYRPRPRCASPGCGWWLTAATRAGLHGGFCRPCAARLAAIRGELESRGLVALEARGHDGFSAGYLGADDPLPRRVEPVVVGVKVGRKRGRPPKALRDHLAEVDELLVEAA